MFHSNLYTKPQESSYEQINIGLEKSFAELDSATALLERLTLARESFSALPDDQMSQPLVTLFASNFVDVPSALIPETAHSALESATTATGKEMKRFALESGDGIISKIWTFIKKLIASIRDFLGSIIKKINTPFTYRYDFGSAFNVTVKPTEDFAVFVINGDLDANTINTATKEMTTVATNLLNICKKLEASTSKFDYKPATVEAIFGFDQQLPLIPKTDWPGTAFMTVSENLEASIELDKSDKPTSLPSFGLSRMSIMSDYGKAVEATRSSLAASTAIIDKALLKLDKEADALAKDREGMAQSSSDDITDVVDIKTQREDERSPYAIRTFVKIAGTLTRGISGVSLRFMEHEHKAMRAIVTQAQIKA